MEKDHNASTEIASGFRNVSAHRMVLDILLAYQRKFHGAFVPSCSGSYRLKGTDSTLAYDKLEEGAAEGGKTLE